jgi:hypothetical protein
MKLEFSGQIFEKYLNVRFQENPSSGSRVTPRGRTNLTELKVPFPSRERAKQPLNCSNTYTVHLCTHALQRIQMYLHTPQRSRRWRHTSISERSQIRLSVVTIRGSPITGNTLQHYQQVSVVTLCRNASSISLNCVTIPTHKTELLRN